ncbi:MAG: flagellar filament capping protein FliD [Thermincolia bacterium]
MSELKVSGLVSGLDTKGLINQLMKIERQPILNMQSRQKTLQLRKDLWSEINTNLLALKTSLEPLMMASTMGAKITTSSNETLLTATADASAAVGAYKVTVHKLATNTKITGGTGALGLGLGGTIDPAVAVGTTGARLGTTITTGTFTINGTTITIDAATESMNAIVTKINGAGAGVTASYSATTDRLTITANTPGGNLNFGAGGNTSNFLSATGLLAATRSGDTKTSQFHLGYVNPGVNLNAANFATAVTSGSFRVNGVEIAYNVTQDTLNGVISRINSSTAGVTAAYDQMMDRIILTSKNTGSISIALQQVSGNFLTAANLVAGTQTLGDNAEITVDGYNNNLRISKTTNTINDVIAGVTLNLKAIDNANPVTVEVKQNTKEPIDKIADFVNKFNSTMNLLNDKMYEKIVKEPLTDFDRRKGLLSGERTLAKTKLDLGNVAMEKRPGLPANLDQLSEIGIELKLVPGSNGKVENLVINTTKLEQALKDNPNGLAKLFFNDDDVNGVPTKAGIAVSLDHYLKGLTDTTTTIFNSQSLRKGVVPQNQDVLTKQIEKYNADIVKFEERLEIREKTLYAQFTAMERMLLKFQNQGNWLSGQLAGLSR